MGIRQDVIREMMRLVDVCCSGRMWVRIDHVKVAMLVADVFGDCLDLW